MCPEPTEKSPDNPCLSGVADCLLNIEAEMRQLEIWSFQRPAEEALASTQPFCIDTLSFPEWLQFIFLERMKQLVESNRPLPSVSGIAPMAEEYLRGLDISGRRLVQRLEEMDQLLSRS